MEAQNATKADLDDDYLDDAVVRPALERLQREFKRDMSVRVVKCERFYGVDEQKTDYIDMLLQDSVTGHGLARIVQDAIDTGVVRVTKIDDKTLQFVPTEN